MRRGFFQISFAWLFAIIAGAAILFLAIFFSTRLIHIGQSETSSEAQVQLAALLDPLETSFQSGEVATLQVPTETRIYNNCSNRTGTFGKQIISISQKSFNKWSTPTAGTSFQNKYIFSQGIVEGKDFALFSKPFNLPFKVSDLIYLTSLTKDYCFVAPPTRIGNEISTLGQSNIKLENDRNNCRDSDITVCFAGQACDIKVDYSGADDSSSGQVTKDGKTVDFAGDALMFGAIFSDAGDYECQLERLVQRASQLVSVYNDKKTIVGSECTSEVNLQQLSNDLGSYADSGDLAGILEDAKNVETQNDNSGRCRLW